MGTDLYSVRRNLRSCPKGNNTLSSYLVTIGKASVMLHQKVDRKDGGEVSGTKVNSDAVSRSAAIAEYQHTLSLKNSMKRILDNHKLANTVLLSLHNPEAPSPTVVVPMIIHGADITFELHQSPVCGVGGLLWRSGEILARYILNNLSYITTKHTIVELGCGAAALPSQVAAIALPATVIATDTEPVLATTRQNIEHNLSGLSLRGSVEVRQCDWEWVECPSLQADVIIAADVIYARRTQEMLVATISRILKPDGLLILTYAERDLAVERSFFEELLAVAHIEVTVVDSCEVNEQMIYTIRGSRAPVSDKIGNEGIYL